jgi:alpha-tubulin suppressor-like RCC1 family protein
MSGLLFAWGSNISGECGSDTSGNEILSPTQIGEDQWSKIDACDSYSVGIKANGTLWEWGDTINGDKTAPVQVGTDDDWMEVSAGYVATYALKSDGSLWVWGGNAYYDLGLGEGDTTARYSPVKTHDGPFVSISAGFRFGMALTAGGDRYFWGYNNDGQAGNGYCGFLNGEAYEYVFEPTLIDDGITWSFVCCSRGGYYALGLSSSGEVYGWGFNFGGGLGLDWDVYDTYVVTPQRSAVDASFSEIIATGDAASLLLKQDGSIGVAGEAFGEAGDGTWGRDEPDSWYFLEHDQAYVGLYASDGFHVFGLSGGYPWLWGYECDHGLRGNGTFGAEEQLTPYQITTISDVIALAPGYSHVLALVSVKCVGNDMNPAHIIYECLTDKQWGMGYNE